MVSICFAKGEPSRVLPISADLNPKKRVVSRRRVRNTLQISCSDCRFLYKGNEYESYCATYRLGALGGVSIIFRPWLKVLSEVSTDSTSHLVSSNHGMLAFVFAFASWFSTLLLAQCSMPICGVHDARRRWT